MEDIKIDESKLNIDNGLPNVPRLPDGKIDLDTVSLGKNEKDNYIVPDEIMQAYYKELPNGTVNESKTFTAYNGGLLKALNDEIRRKGAEALNAERAQRRKMSETIDILLKKKATPEEIEQLGLEDGATKQDALMAAMLLKAIERGDVQAGAFIRDTAGEKPTEKISAEVETITPEDRKQIERILNRTKTQDIVVGKDQE
jgi:hypothetical protein